ncbi:MAG: SDR family oxidoreductase [Saprospiraceae bacterium]|nr:SDR family oxidoreductase [Saprospiraceae bacterium]
MKILLTGVTGYIGQRLLPVLLEKGHEVVCCTRDKSRFDRSKYPNPNLSVIELDLLNQDTLSNIPKDIEAAYYLVHSMASSEGDFEEKEKISAQNFLKGIKETSLRQIIYLSGIVNEDHLSKHLASRKKVEDILSESSVPVTTLRAGIIIGSGSASFEIMRDLVEKLPVMVAPKWLKTKCQPISIRNVLTYLEGVLGKDQALGKSFDIGGPDVLTYKEMLLRFAKVRKLNRKIWVVPVMTPRLSSYWLYFVTATSYPLAQHLVDSMKINVIANDEAIKKLIPQDLIGYEESIQLAFDKIAQNEVLSSWKDAMSSDLLDEGISKHIEVPVNGCFIDKRKTKITDPEATLAKIFSIGGENGWYYGNWMWKLRGFLDKLVGGVGLRRGRKNPDTITAGESLDFWRVLLASKKERRLLLYAEMKLPGEAWIEFKITPENELVQTATFRPWGILGRLYWYSVLPFHAFVFEGMIQNLANSNPTVQN